MREAECIVVGAGPSGVAFAEHLARIDERCNILVLGDEPGRPYDRVRLSSLLAREVPAGALYTDQRLRARANVTVLTRRRIVGIDRAAKVVHDAAGEGYRYESLVLATSSRARVPAIPGIELPGVYVFRSMGDKAGLAHVTANPGERYYTEETLGGVRYFTAVYPDVAVAPACVSCHNDHPDSPRRDFELGDVMGGVVIRIPLE